MSDLWLQIQELIKNGEIAISVHGYEELAADNINVRDLVNGISEAISVEEYPTYYKGPCILVLQTDLDDNPIHVLWGIPRGKKVPAVLITAYRPDPEKWMDGFTRTKRMTKKRQTKIVHEGQYVAEVDVELIYTDDDWSPYLSLEDAYKLDDVREALRDGDIVTAARMARIYKLTPVAV